MAKALRRTTSTLCSYSEVSTAQIENDESKSNPGTQVHRASFPVAEKKTEAES